MVVEVDIVNNFENTNYSKLCVENWNNFMHQRCHIHCTIILIVIVAIFVVMITSSSSAKDLGNYGQTYKIKEEDPIEYTKLPSAISLRGYKAESI